MSEKAFKNPFRPGAGHMPPYLAGRDEEINEFKRLLEQDVILENLVLTGLRGVGKTVLLETLKPHAISSNWLWVGTDLSESSSVSEETMAIRLLADLSAVTGQLAIHTTERKSIGLKPESIKEATPVNYPYLEAIYRETPGLASDKLKKVLEFAWDILKGTGKRGIVFAYDEAQNLADHAASNQFPLSLLLDLFQSLQKKDIPFMLALTGLPPLFPKLVEARTFSERMFHIIHIDRLKEADCRKAITEPTKKQSCPVHFSDVGVENIILTSGGYPYFIQFICREAYDIYIQQVGTGTKPNVHLGGVIRKLDADFFEGRWSKATDRQRELLELIASMETSDAEFTVAEIVEHAEKTKSTSQVSQMLSRLCDAGLIYKNRHGKYSFAVPLLGQFIKRRSGISTIDL